MPVTQIVKPSKRLQGPKNDLVTPQAYQLKERIGDIRSLHANGILQRQDGKVENFCRKLE